MSAPERSRREAHNREAGRANKAGATEVGSGERKAPPSTHPQLRGVIPTVANQEEGPQMGKLRANLRRDTGNARAVLSKMRREQIELDSAVLHDWIGPRGGNIDGCPVVGYRRRVRTGQLANGFLWQLQYSRQRQFGILGMV
jgi:hypothetical protein